MRYYSQLTREQRYQIYALKKKGHYQKAIAETIGVHESTVSREIRRNSGKRGYRPQQAQKKAQGRQLGKVPNRIQSCTWETIEALIRLEWSPEQISARLLQEGKVHISHEWIYQHIYQDKFSGGNLHTHLRCRKKRRKRYGSHDRRGQVPNRVFIDHRPAVVEAQTRIGDWEADTIIGKGHKGALLSVVERKSLFTVIKLIENLTSFHVGQKFVEGMKFYKDRLHTLTLDNGREFAGHEQIANELDANIFFAHPYASWERGINENTNGLIRQYFPKTCSLSNLTSDNMKHVMERLNNRPRKKLGFKTPFEVFFKRKTKLTNTIALIS